MSEPKAFDQKNKDDFDRYTELLSKGLHEIAINDSLKATVAELSRITGVHRNTIRMRVWPLQKLETIKENRQIEALRKQVSKNKPADPVKVLTEKLESARVEVLHWFGQSNKSEDQAEENLRLYTDMKKSRDTYRNLLADANERLLASQAEIDRLRQVISILEAAQAEKSA
ncbi:hypothetical protein NPS49_02210 [Pseudomonas putida]|uniref:hypothetical protein n=1 Tax=Pseudomonas TaxID=286 RepID=UPI0023633F66|nr:hypothetical protein [Pseudomonas putida]MDD2067126.1 hypothetical protein [Pseudomonas putida]HDS1738729.1 hypothetical protein [Pseudomonas putida]